MNRFCYFILTLFLFLYFHNQNYIAHCQNCEHHKCKNKCFVLNDDRMVCLCNANEKGIHCKEKWNVCEKDCNIEGIKESCSVALCKTGTCIPIEHKPYYRCECGEFFKGKNCEIENNPCTFPETNPCLNGTCIFINKLNRIICKCDNGWKQKNTQNSTMLNWGNQKVEVPPPCDEQIKRGLSKYVVYHTPASYAMWWLVYVVSVLVLFLCCCNVCFNFFSNSMFSYLGGFNRKKNE